ncbi:MAG: hypothetical protein QM527_08160 [Alphaproteobacteria bacterium]|nr:hypothetical protein [Alphaproteobacteria bacterium]
MYALPTPSSAQDQAGHALLGALTALALLGVMLSSAQPALHASGQRSMAAQARSSFEADWWANRWQSLRLGRGARLQTPSPCPATQPCPWQWVAPDIASTARESQPGSTVRWGFKPAEGWRIDAWGEPLSGGASAVFQAQSMGLGPAAWLCLNALGRLRRVQGQSCSE